MYLIEAVNQIDDSCLAGSRSTYKGYLLSWIGVDVNVKEYLFLLGVAEVNILKVHITLGIFQRDGTFIHLGCCIHQCKDALSTDRGIEYTVDLLRNLRDRLGKALVQLQKCHDGS